MKGGFLQQAPSSMPEGIFRLRSLQGRQMISGGNTRTSNDVLLQRLNCRLAPDVPSLDDNKLQMSTHWYSEDQVVLKASVYVELTDLLSFPIGPSIYLRIYE